MMSGLCADLRTPAALTTDSGSARLSGGGGHGGTYLQEEDRPLRTQRVNQTFMYGILSNVHHIHDSACIHSEDYSTWSVRVSVCSNLPSQTSMRPTRDTDGISVACAVK